MVPTFEIPPHDPRAAQAARLLQDRLTKPAGSLGVLEDLPVQLASLQHHARPRSRPASAVIFAADHPVAARGVSAYPQAVTAAMMGNFAEGGAAAAVAARLLGVMLQVVDVGVATPYRIRQGDVAVRRDPVAEAPAGDIVLADAMSEATAMAAVRAGSAVVDELPGDTRVLILGEMGIGNTTVAAAVAAALLGEPADALTGAGTGVSGESLARKREVVATAVARVRGASPWRVLTAVGGRELAALVGAAGRAAERGMAVLVDGFIVSTAMLVLTRLAPESRAHLIFAHRSQEFGHRRVLEAMDARPLLDLALCLGEASGALAALPLVDLACAWHAEMATFESSGVPERAPS
jgi:nicotinate-nucleotide--dimethylbenzimidazole phosphoribosyltransferase